MDPNVRYIPFSYGYNETVVNPLALALLAGMVILLFVLPRQRLVIPFVVVACFITSLQRVVIFGLDFDFVRILLVAGLARLALSGEYRTIRRSPVDTAVFLFILSSAILNTLQLKSFDAFVNRAGFGFDVLGTYLFFRWVIRTTQDLEFVVKAVAILAIPMAASMFNEQMTGRNLYSVFGGVPEFTELREGRLRSQAAFTHPIMAGTFGAVFFPLIVGWGLRRPSKVLFAGMGAAMAVVIVLTSSSSGPLMGLAAAMLGLAAWKVRHRMRLIRWTIVAGVLGLHIVMKDPVWALIWRFTVIGGSTGYFRYRLIDASIRRFKEWWLWGTTNMANWGWGLQDVTNQYIRIGVDGGALTLLLFIITMAYAYQAVGRAVRSQAVSSGERWLLWGLGAALFANTISFIGVSYHGQMVFFYYLMVAAAASMGAAYGSATGKGRQAVA